MRIKDWISKKLGIQARVRRMIKCICSGEQFRVDEIVSSSESLATRDYSASGYSSRAGEMDTKVDNSNIEEAESSLRESGYLNYEVGCICVFSFVFLLRIISNFSYMTLLEHIQNILILDMVVSVYDEGIFLK